MEATTNKRRWWQFGIRDVLWLMVVSAMSCGWWAHERYQKAQFEEERKSLKAQINELQGWEERFGVWKPGLTPLPDSK